MEQRLRPYTAKKRLDSFPCSQAVTAMAKIIVVWCPVRRSVDDMLLIPLAHTSSSALLNVTCRPRAPSLLITIVT
jgi:hypothetical protein